jgi:transcriptional regulator with XRE-family HTH domain
MSLLDKLFEYVPRKDDVPNKLTIAVGEKTRQARDEIGMDAAQLAEMAYLSRPQLSAYEMGAKTLLVSELVYLAVALNKPLGYFLPDRIREMLDPGYLSVEEPELLQLYKKLEESDREKVFAQLRAWIRLA